MLVRFPAASCPGVGQAVPVLSVMFVISFTSLCVRFWSNVVVPLTFVKYALLLPCQFPVAS
jgi:hypothetical protein